MDSSPKKEDYKLEEDNEEAKEQVVRQ